MKCLYSWNLGQLGSCGRLPAAISSAYRLDALALVKVANENAHVYDAWRGAAAPSGRFLAGGDECQSHRATPQPPAPSRPAPGPTGSLASRPARSRWPCWRRRGPPDARRRAHLRFVFENAGQLVKGDVVRIGGTPAGTVKAVELTDDGRAQITVAVDDDYAPLHDGTTATIRAQGLIGVANRYVDISPAPRLQGRSSTTAR